ncbi:hypothetical protein FACS1894217_05610 [Clostridia bacterium]|nr:hypothetical protein FACS1894217_05610 [Clostridia bacterium]
MSEPLTATQRDLIQATAAYGGYVARGMVELHRPDLSDRYIKKLLSSLADSGYLRQAAYVPYKEQRVYQVTSVACKFCGCPNSHMRRNHQPDTMRRYLLRSHFLFANAPFSEYKPLSDTAGRIAYFNQRGVNNTLLPSKVNKSTTIVQIEEPILTFQPFAPKGGVCVVFVDRPTGDPLKQLMMWLDRYMPLIRSKALPLVFLSVVEDSARGVLYENLYKTIRTRTKLPKFSSFSIEHAYNYCGFE